MNDNLYNRLVGSRSDPDSIAIETADGKRYSYANLDQLSGQCANVLTERGVNLGDRVAAKVEKSLAALILYLGTLRAGATFLPLNSAYTVSEAQYFLNDAEPTLVVCDPSAQSELANVLPKSVSDILTLDSAGEGSLTEAARQAARSYRTAVVGSDDLAAILYTSGTTGRSKGAMLTHGNLASNADALRREWQYGPKDVLVHALPIYHTHGLFVATNVTLGSGASMILLPKFDTDQILRLLPRASVLMGVPTFYTRLLTRSGLDRETTAAMRLFISGSAPLLAETHREWLARTGHAILERYGMTETNMITSNPYDGERVAGSVGFPLSNVSVRVCDPETKAPLSKDEVGMIEVRGPNVFKGYWRMPEKTAEEFRSDGYFITGDLGKIDPRGYLHIVGRGKDLIISGGFNVYPKEIENAIDDIPGVEESAVIGIADSDFGEAVTAVVVARPDATLNERAVLIALQGKLAKFKQPKHIHFVAELPRNAMGKVQKNVLRERYSPQAVG